MEIKLEEHEVHIISVSYELSDNGKCKAKYLGTIKRFRCFGDTYISRFEKMIGQSLGCVFHIYTYYIEGFESKEDALKVVDLINEKEANSPIPIFEVNKE